MGERKFTYGKFGLTENPIGKHVSMPWEERKLLGEVVGITYDDVRGMLHLKVKHFCGDPWPVSPVVSAVTILE